MQPMRTPLTTELGLPASSPQTPRGRTADAAKTAVPPRKALRVVRLSIVFCVMFPASKDEPVYILCSASGAEDKATALVRIYNVVEKIQVFKLTPDLNLNFLPRPFPLRMPAVWRHQED